MIADGLSLFGFDLFGISRRARADAEREKTPAQSSPTGDADRRSDTRADDKEFSESLFWGIHPFY